MHDFLIKQVLQNDIKKELDSIGFDQSYIHKAKDKFNYLNLKLYDLTCGQANIIKQTALSIGADCATHRDVITGKIEKSDAILGGSISQLYKIADKLQFQPFGLKDLGEVIKLQCQYYSKDLRRPKLVGILNITPDSFSDGGEYFNIEKASNRFYQMIEEGADIIDIGAESTRPGFESVEPDLQLTRLIPLLKAVKFEVPVSIDTRSAAVAKKCIEFGANIINDVSGLSYDPEMADVIASNAHVKIIIQHWDNYLGMDELYKTLRKKTEFAISKGIHPDNIILDPGIGFGKTRENNFEILNRWLELKSMGYPIMIGVSRKSLLDMKDSSNEEKDLYTLALNSALIKDGVDYLRVHNVKIHRRYLDLICQG